MLFLYNVSIFFSIKQSSLLIQTFAEFSLLPEKTKMIDKYEAKKHATYYCY